MSYRFPLSMLCIIASMSMICNAQIVEDGEIITSGDILIGDLQYHLDPEKKEACVFQCIYDGPDDRKPFEFPENVVIPTSVEYGGVIYSVTGVNAFEQTNNVKSVFIPESVKYVYGFYYTKNLKELIIEDGVTEFGGLLYCTSLHHLDLPVSISHFGTQFGSRSALENFYIPPMVENLDNCQDFMEECPNLLSVDLGAILKSLPKAAFSGCRALERITIPASMVTLGKNVFLNCSGLTVIELLPLDPICLNSAFVGCPAITRIYCHSEEPYVCDAESFRDVDFEACTLYVPSGASGRYSSASGWNRFRNIVEFDPSGVELVSGSDSLSISADGRVVVTGSPAEISSLSGSLSITATEENCADIRLQPGVYAARQGSASSSHIVVR